MALARADVVRRRNREEGERRNILLSLSPFLSFPFLLAPLH
jgi:hypothetical protein